MIGVAELSTPTRSSWPSKGRSSARRCMLACPIRSRICSSNRISTGELSTAPPSTSESEGVPPRGRPGLAPCRTRGPEWSRLRGPAVHGPIGPAVDPAARVEARLLGGT
jgi:hypothetical protein